MRTQTYFRTGTMPRKPVETEWAHANRQWISLRGVRLDGGFVFASETVAIKGLFAESWPEMPRLLFDGTTYYIVSGEISVVRTMLDGKSGFEGLVLPA